MHKDAAGNTLSEGDKIVFHHDQFTGTLQVGIVTGFTPQKVKLDWYFKPDDWRNYGREKANPDGIKPLTKFPYQVAKVPC